MQESNELNVVVGNGAVGRAMTRELLRRGRRVRVAHLDPHDVVEGAESVLADLSFSLDAARAFEGARTVFLMASPPYTQWPKLYPPLMRGVLDGAAKAGTRVVVVASDLMYAPSKGPITEDSPQWQGTAKAKVVRQLGALCAEARQAGLPVLELRTPECFGPGLAELGHFGARVMRPAMNGESLDVIGDPDAPHSLVYIPDLARHAAFIADQPQAWGQVWHVPSTLTSVRGLLQRVAAVRGKTLHLSVTPTLVFPLLGLFVPMMRELGQTRYMWTNPHHFSHAKWTAAFGEPQLTPLDEAARQTVQWFLDNPHPPRASRPHHPLDFGGHSRG